MGPEEPTYHGGAGRPDVLDIAILKAIPMEAEISKLHEGGSDHIPILLTLWTEAARNQWFTRKHTDWDLSRTRLQQNQAPARAIETEQDVEEAIQELEENIHNAIATSITETRVRRIKNPCGELPPATRRLITDRRAALKRAMWTRLPQDKRALNQANRRVKAALGEHREEMWQQRLEALNPQDRSLWNMQKALRMARKPFPPIHGENGVAYMRKDKAEAFVNSIEGQCREVVLQDEDENHTNLVERRARRLEEGHREEAENQESLGA